MGLESKIQNIFPEEKQIPSDVAIQEPIRQKEYLIAGELRLWNGESQDVYSSVFIQKSDGLQPKLLGTYPLMTQKESLEALNAACDAYNQGRGVWPTMSVEQRIKHVQDFMYRMKQKKKEVVKILMWEIGKSLQDSEKEFDRTVDYIADTIEAVKELDRTSSRLTIQQSIIGQIRRSPLGVVLCMGPYNYPLNETFTILIPALIMGNTVIFKPPKMGVLLHKPLLEAFQKSFPPGVVNTVYGEGKNIISPLMSSGKIDVLAFIGSSKVADILKKQHPKPHRLRCILGLEAKNAGIILSDADLDLAIKESILGTLSFNGQRCTALKILFVHSQILEPFLAKLNDAIQGLKIGMPWEENVKITPMPDITRIPYFTSLIEDAKSKGAKVVNTCGGMTNKTFFFPAVVYPVSNQMSLYTEEQFGPVIPVASFSDIETPIDYIVHSDYGQQVSIFGKNSDLIARMIDPLANQVCRVNINSQCQRGPDTFPFNGRKDSAEGTLSVSDALRVFSIRSLVAAKDGEINKKIITEIVREHKSNFLSTDFVL